MSEVFHLGTPALSSRSTAPVASAARHLSMPPTTRSPRFVIPTAMDGSSRKSRRGCPADGLSNLDVSTLTELLQEAEKHHGQYEPTAPKHHWSGWYARLHRRASGSARPRRGSPGRQDPHRGGTLDHDDEALRRNHYRDGPGGPVAGSSVCGCRTKPSLLSNAINLAAHA